MDDPFRTGRSGSAAIDGTGGLNVETVARGGPMFRIVKTSGEVLRDRVGAAAAHRPGDARIDGVAHQNDAGEKVGVAHEGEHLERCVLRDRFSPRVGTPTLGLERP